MVYDELSEGCKLYLFEHDITTTPEAPTFDAEVVARGICNFMYNNGFRLVDSELLSEL